MEPKLTILIPTLPQRDHFRRRLEHELGNQIRANDVRVKLMINEDARVCIGTKRNHMMAEVNTEYMAFFDDDDMPGPNYIKHLMEGIAKGVDCCSLTGIITTDGANPRKFIHSIQYADIFEKDGIYYRPIMHINCLKTEHARQAAFPEWRFSEDSKWAMDLMAKGVLKKEHYIDDVIYNYLYVSDKRY